MIRFTLPLYFVFLVAAHVAVAAEPMKTESFDRDPQWTARNNRQVPTERPTVTQNFGYSPTNHAGKSPGEMGGTVRRASEPAFYAAKIEPKTLDDKLSASGTFALTKTTPGGGIFLGFFRGEQPGGGGRPIGSFGLNLDSEHTGGRLAVRLITGQNQSCGTFITPYVPGKYRPTTLKNDGTRYAFQLDYDPQAAEGRGRFTCTFTSDNHPAEPLDPALSDVAKAEARVRFPQTTTFSVDLPEGYRQQATTLDHFGLMNMMKAGGAIDIFVDDLTINGAPHDFATDPNWGAAGNRRTYQPEDVSSAQNFGYGETNHAGGKPGEVGGVFWRTEANWGYYADRVGPLTFDDRLEAGGKVKLVVGGPDADMCFGWFGTDDGESPPNRGGDFIGVKVGGPTRVGHMLAPTFYVNENLRGLAEQAPRLVPGRPYEWSLVYDPAANDGLGAITVTLGDQSTTLDLKPGQKAKAKEARLDRFGLFSIYPGGQIVKIYLDDLTYTTAKN